jgi:hypothetical protein
MQLYEVMRFVDEACENTKGWRSDPARIAEVVHGCLSATESLEFVLPGFATSGGTDFACIAIATTRQVLRLDDDDSNVHSTSYRLIEEIETLERDDGADMKVLITTTDGHKHSIKTKNFARGRAFVEFVKEKLGTPGDGGPSKRSIVRVPTTELTTEITVSAQMAMFGRNASDEDSLYTRAMAVAMPYASRGGGVERGDRPASPRRGFAYLSWEWDRQRREFRVVTWDGSGWR